MKDFQIFEYGIMDALSKGWEVFQSLFLDISILALVILLPVNLIGTVGWERGLQHGPGFVRPSVWNVVSFFGFLLFAGFVSLLVLMALATIVKNQLYDEDVNLRDSVCLAWSRMGGGIVTAILMCIIIGLLMMLLFIPGLIFAVYYTFGLYVVALRDWDGMEALNYSKRLVTGNWWRIFGLVLTVGIIAQSVNWLVTRVLDLLALGVASQIISAAVSSFLSLFSMVVLTVIFLNLDSLKYRRGE